MKFWKVPPLPGTNSLSTTASKFVPDRHCMRKPWDSNIPPQVNACRSTRKSRTICSNWYKNGGLISYPGKN